MTTLKEIPLCQLAVAVVLACLAFALDFHAGLASLLASTLLIPEACYALGARRALSGPQSRRAGRALRARALKLVTSLALLAAGAKLVGGMVAAGSSATLLGGAWLGTLIAIVLVPLAVLAVNGSRLASS